MTKSSSSVKLCESNIPAERGREISGLDYLNRVWSNFSTFNFVRIEPTAAKMSRYFLFQLIASLFFLPVLCFSQFQDRHNDSTKLKKSNLGIEATASMLPRATIRKEQGKYKLKSAFQSSYDLGLNYRYNIDQHTTLIAGLHFVVGKRNWFLSVPQQEMPPNVNGLGLIEDKGLWGSFRLPLLIEKEIAKSRLRIIAGLNLRYSGLMLDEGYGSPIFDSSYGYNFHAELSARNDSKPWLTFLGGLSKSILLDNKNVLSIGLHADISTTYFLKSNYEIDIPNQPYSTGTYKVSGSGLGLSIQYIFTGTNKQIVKPKKNDPGTPSIKRLAKKDILEKYVFSGNHIQFNFAWLSTIKAKLKNTAGNYPVSSSAAPGLLLSARYQINFNNKYSLIAGPEAMLPGRNFHASFSKNDFSPPLISGFDTKGYLSNLVLSLPMIIEKRWFYPGTKFLFANAGLRLNFSLGFDYDGYSIFLPNTSNWAYNVGGVDVNSINDGRPWISFPINAGHSWLAKNNNLLQLAICSNISFTKYVNGTYEVAIPNQSLTEGRYSSTGSFIGLSFNYVFTNANYRIRKVNETRK